MPLKIKIPKQGSNSRDNTAERTSATPARLSKRRRVESEDEDSPPPPPQYDSHDEENVIQQPPRKLKRRRSSAAAEDDDVDVETETYVESAVSIEVDVEVDDDDMQYSSRSASAGPSKLPAKSGASRQSRTTKGKTPASSSRKGSVRKGRRKAPEFTDDEEADDFDDDSDMSEPISEDGDVPKRRKSVSKGKPRGGKASLVRGGKKAGKEREEKEIHIRDERKLLPAAETSKSREGTSASEPDSKLHHRDDERSASPSAKVPDEGASRADAPPKDIEHASNIAKKKSLAFKKNKLPTNTSTPITPASAKPPLQRNDSADPAGVALPRRIGVNDRKPAAHLGSADFDLRDATVYAALFKAGGSTPNSGLNRKEKEAERRQELNRMREEARRKREEEAKQSFDLQAPHEKIQRFEEKLRARKSPAVFLNMLGAAFKHKRERAPGEPERK